MDKAAQKLKYVARKLGWNIHETTPSTRSIFDKLAVINAANSQYSFFNESASRSFPNTNISTNQFERNEALAIEAVCFFTSGEVGKPNLPVPYVGNGNVNIIIGSQIVAKDMPVKFITTQGTSKNSGSYGVINLAMPVVIPPLVSFRVELTGADALDPIVFENIGCYLYGMGLLLNFKTGL